MQKFTVSDAKKRDAIIFPDGYQPSAYGPDGGMVRSFSGLNLSKLNKLIYLGYADPDEAQNCAPTIGEFKEFMADYPKYTAHGYTVSPKRNDFRVSIEGIEKDTGYETAEELEDFISMFRHADEFNVSKTGMYCWYD